MALTLSCRVERFPLVAPFRIAGHVFDESEVVVVELAKGGRRGRGEGGGVYYLGDDAAHMMAVLKEHRGAIQECRDREHLRHILPPGGARNAVDCALWELEAARAARPAAAIAGIAEPRPLVTTFTLGADDPATMAASARKMDRARAIKLKLTGDLDLDCRRVSEVRAARGDVWLGVDANQGYAIDDLAALIDALLPLGVALIEQPLARGREADLDRFERRIPLAADESALGLDDVAGLVGRFDFVNIKLDKCGGLTEALLIAAEARRLGLGVMVGNMVGTSLAMAPAFILGQLCDVVDLDGPTFLARDRQPAVEYRDGTIWCPAELWGTPEAAALAA